MEDLSAELARLDRLQRRRTLALPAGLDFSSNDYLQLSRHPALIAAVEEALDSQGCVGAGASRLLRGHHESHAALESLAAQMFGAEKALYFATGFLANFALLTTLLGRHDTVIFDERIHASIKEGAHACRAARFKARHNDVAAFEAALRKARARKPRRILIAVESVYSMDGDFAPLAELAALARAFEATLLVDEAHATGIYGATGRGLSEGLRAVDLISVHTCGKALGVAGALVCASAEIIDSLISMARPFLYSTAPPPLLTVAVARALRLIEEEPWRRTRLIDLAGFAREALSAALPDLAPGLARSHIIPVVLGAEERALSVAAALRAGGFDIRAIRPPTVPKGTSRLRVSLNVGLTETDIAAMIAALAESLRP